MCFVFISEQTATCATYSINWLVFITEMKSVYSAVRTGSLNKAVCGSSVKGYLWLPYCNLRCVVNYLIEWMNEVRVNIISFVWKAANLTPCFLQYTSFTLNFTTCTLNTTLFINPFLQSSSSCCFPALCLIYSFGFSIRNLPYIIFPLGRSQWPRGLRRRSAAARLLRSCVRPPPEAWMFVCCECCVLLGRGLCDELITRPEESYRLCCVVVCDLETSRMRRPWPALGRSTTEKKNPLGFAVLCPLCN